MSDPIRIDSRDLFSPKVEEYLEQRVSVQQGMPETEPVPLVLKILYSNYFYLSVACLVGALLAWGLVEPFIDDKAEDDSGGLLLFPATAGMIGLFLGAAEGIICRNFLRALISAIVGAVVGFVGAAILLIPTNILYILCLVMIGNMDRVDPERGVAVGIGVLIQMFGRSFAWALVAIPAGLGQGIALREWRVVMNGLLGAVIGGLLGGLLFDPIYMVLKTADEQAIYSRAVGLGAIGLMVGFFVGLVEQWTKSAWLLMRAGPLAGKQFVLYRNPTVLGSSPKADVYLFKDDAIEPRHALIYNRGGRFEIDDGGTPAGTYVNGQKIKTQILKAGDQIQLGKTILEFTVKDTEE